jgi:hypothetical protein
VLPVLPVVVTVHAIAIRSSLNSGMLGRHAGRVGLRGTVFVGNIFCDLSAWNLS